MIELRRAMPFLAFPVLAFALALLISGCDAAQGPAASPSPSAIATVEPPPSTAPTPAGTEAPTPEPTKRTALSRHRDRWAATGIESYRMTLSYGCFCEFGDGRPIRLHVVNGELADASSEGTALKRRDLRGFPVTVEDLFDLIAAQRKADRLEVTYDQELGYPTAIDIDAVANADDDEFSVDVVRFDPED